MAGDDVDILPGNALPLKNIPLGTHGPQRRAEAGQGRADRAQRRVRRCSWWRKEGDYASVKMPSGEIRQINVECLATIGQVGNIDHENVSIGKAGRSRWLGKRPHVRGVAMNPVDHPLGGGEGKTSGGRHPVSPWGMPTKGYKTRNAEAHRSVHRHAAERSRRGSEAELVKHYGQITEEGSVHRRSPAREGRRR